MIRHAWIGAHADVTQKRQCVLAGVLRTTVYGKRKAVLFVEADELLKRLIAEEYTRHTFYGSSKMVVYAERCGHRVKPCVIVIEKSTDGAPSAPQLTA